MDIVLFLLGFILVLLGVIGSFLPIIPGPPLSWVGLLLLYLTKAVPNDWTMIVIMGLIALAITALDYIIPAVGTKKFGGSKAGIWGTTIGLLVALFFPVFGPLGIIIWPFIGAFVGELLNKSNQKTALKAAFGSFLGFITGTFLKFVVTIVFLGLFINLTWTNRMALFPWFAS